MQFYTFDEDYVRRLAEGDRSVEEHFAGYFGELLSIKLRGRVRSRDALEEVRQETIVRVLQTLRQKGLEHPDRLGAFVSRVCDNVLCEHFRAQARYDQMNVDSHDWPDPRINLEAPLINRELTQLVGSVLADLSEQDRELLRLIFFEEVEKTEACERLGVSQGYLRVLLYRAKCHFREKLAKRDVSAAQRLVSWVKRNPLKRDRPTVHHKIGGEILRWNMKKQIE